MVGATIGVVLLGGGRGPVRRDVRPAASTATPTPTPSPSASPSPRPSPSPSPSPSPHPTVRRCPIAGTVFGGRFRAAVAEGEGEVSAAVFDAVSGRTFTFGHQDHFHTGSIVKVQILGALLHRARVAHRFLTADERSLMTRMIEISDNDAATALWNDVGGSAGVAAFDRVAGMTDTEPNPAHWGDTTTTALDNVNLIRHLAFDDDLLDPGRRALALDLMEHVIPSQRFGVSAGVPPGSTIALKDGWLPLGSGNWEVNSVGYIRGRGRQYVLAVLTDRDPTFQSGVDAVDLVSRLVWNASRC